MTNYAILHAHVQHCTNIVRNRAIITYSTSKIVYEIAFLIYFSLRGKYIYIYIRI